MKKCAKCKEVKPFDQFYVSSGTKTGRRSRCIECMRSDVDNLVQTPVPEKRCSMCEETKPAEKFYKSRVSRDGLAARCDECTKTVTRQWAKANPEKTRQNLRNWHDRNRGRRYGLTPEQYAVELEKSGGVCGICRNPPTENHPRLAVDHDHVTLKVRGMLCHACNLGIGVFKDDPERLMAAAEWVRSHRD
jgi:hypothetical protein